MVESIWKNKEETGKERGSDNRISKNTSKKQTNKQNTKQNTLRRTPDMQIVYFLFAIKYIDTGISSLRINEELGEVGYSKSK